MNIEFPRVVGIETINSCNARCPFCPLFQGEAMMNRDTRPATIMDASLFLACVSEIDQWAVKPETIYLNMNGEPLSDPLFASRLRSLKDLELGSIVDLQSNGQFLDEKMAGAILDAKVRRLTLGFDGATPEVYAQHRVRCDFDRVLANIRRFVKMRDAGLFPTRVAIQFVRTRANEHEVVTAYRLFNEFMRPGKDVFQDTLSKDWGDSPSSTPIFFIPKTFGTKPLGCKVFKEQLIVLADGVVCACCWDYNLTVSNGGFGNARDGLLKIWNGTDRGELAKRLASQNLEDKPKKCRSCPYLFGGERIRPELAKLQGEVSEAGFTYHFTQSSSKWLEYV